MFTRISAVRSLGRPAGVGERALERRPLRVPAADRALVLLRQRREQDGSVRLDLPGARDGEHAADRISFLRHHRTSGAVFVRQFDKREFLTRPQHPFIRKATQMNEKDRGSA